MSEFPLCGKSIRKKKHSKIMRFLNISCEAETHTIPKPQNEKTLTLWD